MQKTRVLVVGFGMMGCRHVQAFLQDKSRYEVHVLELSQENIETNLGRIGAQKEDCVWHTNLEEVPVLDVAVVATSSGPRFSIVKLLLEKGYRKFLVEKIVFQSQEQFEQIKELVQKSDAEVYCNFVNRYFEAYKTIKQEVAELNGALRFTVHGGEFGLGCNAIHYIDLFQYLTNATTVSITDASIDVLEAENRRGASYKEFTGTVALSNDRGDQLVLVSEKDYTGGVTINIQKENACYILNENTQKFAATTSTQVGNRPFTIIPTSMLSNVIVEDMFKGTCPLTTLEQTEGAHLELFRIFNQELFAETANDLICPIT